MVFSQSENKVMYTIPLVPVTKKNSQRIVRAGKYYKILPSEKYVQYEKDCKPFLLDGDPIIEPVNIKTVFYMPTRRKVDLVNLQEAILDILVRYGVIMDDNSSIVASMDGSRVCYDRENPRTEIEITTYEHEEER